MMLITDLSFLIMVGGWIGIVSLILYTLIQVRKQHIATNSRLDALLEVTSKLARLEGYEAGKASMTRLKEVNIQLNQRSDNG